MRPVLPSGRQRGAALVIVLWAALILSAALAVALAFARIEARIAASRMEAFESHRAAADGLEFAARAIAEERAGRMDDLNALEFSINGYEMTFAPARESERLDLNLTGEETLARFFRFLGEERQDAVKLAARVADWRDEDHLVRPNGAEARDYLTARNGENIGNRPFYSVDELLLVLDMPEDLAQCAMPALTIFGDGSAPSSALLTELYGRDMARTERAQSVQLGTASRSAAAGRRYAVSATATKAEDSTHRSITLTGVFRITGAPTQPFEWIAQFEAGMEPTTISRCQRASGS